MGAVADVAPPCLVRCAPGYRGLPVARCLSQGGFFTLEGCAAPSIEWTQHGQGECTVLGADPSFASRRAVTLAACQATCESNDGCVAVTYDDASSRCDLSARKPPPHNAGIRSSIDVPECWRLGPPGEPMRDPRSPNNNNWDTGAGAEGADGRDSGDDGVVVIVAIVGILLVIAMVALTRVLRNRLI